MLTAAAIAGKCLGALYRIPLTRVLGAQGMGMFQSVFPLYALLVTVCGGGLTAAVSKLTAESEGRAALHTALKAALVVSLPLVAAAALLAAAGAPAAALALCVLLPAVPVSAVCAAFRGYFQGMGNMMPSAVGQCVEQAAKFAVGISLAFAFSRVSLTAAVAGCAAGVTASEGVMFCFFYWRYKRHAAGGAGLPLPPDLNAAAVFAGLDALTEVSEELVPAPAVVTAARAQNAPVARRLLAVSLPVMLGMLVLPLCQVADSFIVVNLLVKHGAARAYATALYGLVTGPINALVNMPAVLTVGLCGSLLPKVSQLVKRGESVRKTAARVLLFAFAAGAVFCVGIVLFASPALRILYGNTLGVPMVTVTRLLRTAGVAVLSIAVMQTASAVLQGAGKAYLPAVHLLIAAVVKESLLFVLLPRLGAYGFVAATDIFYALACVLDLIALYFCLRRRTRKKAKARG